MDKLAASVGSPFCLTTPSALKSENPSLTQTVDSLSAISKQNRNVLLWLHYTRLMLMIQVFLRLSLNLLDFECDEIIIGGDFNLVLNIDMDKKGRLARTNSKSQEIVNDFAAQFDLIDA